MAKQKRDIKLPPPYLKRVWLDPQGVADSTIYPFCLPLFRSGEFNLSFKLPFTIIAGENGAGKSTLLEGIAALANFDQAGGGKGYRPVDHSRAIEATAEPLAETLRASWLPKIANGWFFRAETFFSVARYLDESGPGADFLSHSHGEGFLRFFEERCQKQGLFIFDEPEAALSPARQIEFLKLLRRMEASAVSQVIIATHSPLLMAYPGADLLHLTKYGLAPARLADLDHFRLMREFFGDPDGFVATMLDM